MDGVCAELTLVGRLQSVDEFVIGGAVVVVLESGNDSGQPEIRVGSTEATDSEQPELWNEFTVAKDSGKSDFGRN